MAPSPASASPASPKNVKSFLLDTNVLIHDPRSIFRFQDNNVIIPVEVIEELDHLKGEQSSERGRNAREVGRQLNGLFQSKEAMADGVPLPDGGRLYVLVSTKAEANKALSAEAQSVLRDQTKKDNQIILAALVAKTRWKPPVILVSKDTQVQLKARSLGMDSEDYLNDQEAPPSELEHLSATEITGDEMRRFCSVGEMEFSEPDLIPGEYLLLHSDEGRYLPAKATSRVAVRKLHHATAIRIPGGRTFRARNHEQTCLIDALLDPEVSLVVASGQAGTGKTVTAVASALHQVLNLRTFERLHISRPVMAMGRDIGFLPGTADQKMGPWLQAYFDALDLLFSPDKDAPRKKGKAREDANSGNGQPAHLPPYHRLLATGAVKIEALTYIRGRSIPNAVLIVDEIQNLTLREVKTIVTRMSEGSKLVLLGDTTQIDNPYLDSQSNGLTQVIRRLAGEPGVAVVNLTKGERSKLAELGAEKL